MSTGQQYEELVSEARDAAIKTVTEDPQPWDHTVLVQYVEALHLIPHIIVSIAIDRAIQSGKLRKTGGTITAP